jgi:hypothetical protein
MTSTQGDIGVHSEYGKLREVVVGHFDDLVYAEWSPSVRYAHPELRALLEARKGETLNVKELVPERHEMTVQQLDTLVETYEAHGVKVHRARRYTDDEKKFLNHLQGGHALIYPCDPAYMLGDHFIELCIRRPTGATRYSLSATSSCRASRRIPTCATWRCPRPRRGANSVRGPAPSSRAATS